MLNNKKIIVILPAYNAESTLEKTYQEIPLNIVDDIILTDDFSSDHTVSLAKKLGINHIIEHSENLGYGANQKSCYKKALDLKADIVVMLHPDYQYNPKLIPAMCSLIANDVFKVVLGSRILGKSALKGGMPIYKYFSNRVLTLFQNLLMGQKLSEYHTGYRSFSGEVLRGIDFEGNSDDFIFDNQLLAQICYQGIEIGEISCPAKYEKDSSSINFSRSVTYGLGVLEVSVKYFLQKLGLKFKLFESNHKEREEGTE
jgi:glycosyltransferase involved in cell wall biosynthesis